jgi:selenophosphate synthetase-related protein
VSRLDSIIGFLGGSAAIGDKLNIRSAYAPSLDAAQGAARLGDDYAAMPDPSGGFLLLAAEGLLRSFVADDPWFAGYSAVMVNISDVCAMGGRPLAVADVLWTPNHETARPVWEGMTAAARDYGVMASRSSAVTRQLRPSLVRSSWRRLF